MLLLEAEFLPPCPLYLMNLIVPGNRLLDPNGWGNALLGQNYTPSVCGWLSLSTSRGAPGQQSRGHHPLGAAVGHASVCDGSTCVFSAAIGCPTRCGCKTFVNCSIGVYLRQRRNCVGDGGQGSPGFSGGKLSGTRLCRGRDGEQRGRPGSWARLSVWERCGSLPGWGREWDGGEAGQVPGRPKIGEPLAGWLAG